MVALSDSSVTIASSTFDRVADLDEQVDDRDVGEVADVGNLHFNGARGDSSRAPRTIIAAHVGQQLRDIDVEAGGQRAVDDAVVGGQRQRQDQARHECLPSHTGFIADLLTPRMATSGALTIGAK